MAEVLTIADDALENVRGILASEPDADDLALWVEVTGSSGPNYTYDLFFAPLSEAAPDDAVEVRDELRVVIPADSVDRLRGATLRMNRDLVQGGMAIENPNKPSAGGPGAGDGASTAAAPDIPEADLSGPLAQRVLEVLDQQINPAIASHGGFAELVAVDDDSAYLRLSGGCQGCGMASVTLSQGIEVAIKEAVPEILRVVDVTDHASGTNPYVEASKK